MKPFTLFFNLLACIGTGYRVRLGVLLGASIFAGLLEVVGIALVFPLVSLVNNPEIVQHNTTLNTLYTFLHLSSPRQMIYFIALAIGLVFILKNVYMIAFQKAQLAFICNWQNYLCESLMDKYLRAPYIFHLKRPSGVMINMLNYTASFVLSSFVMSIILFISNFAVTIILLGFAMFRFFIPSIVAGSVFILLTVAQVILIRRQSQAIALQSNKSRMRNLMVINEALGSVKETKSFGREDYFRYRHKQSNAIVTGFDEQSIFIKTIPMYLTEMVLVFTIIIMAVLTLSNSFQSMQAMTNLAVLAAVAFRLAPMVNRALFAYSQIRVSTPAAIEFLHEVKTLNHLPLEALEPDAKPLRFHKHLRLQDVSFSYDGEASPALQNIDLTIKKGSFVGIIGASGAGKTTLVDILLGLLKPSSGSYYIDSTPVNTLSNLAPLHRMIGYVSQSPNIFDGPLRGNVAFGVAPEDIDDDRVIKALHMAHIESFFATQPDYIHTWIRDNGKNLSGGQRQRVAIARALYANPQIIVLDEATSALDVETEHEITQVINNLKGERTIIAIAHRLSTLRECDHVIYMDAGRIVDIGTFAELNRRHKNFSRLLELSAVQ